LIDGAGGVDAGMSFLPDLPRNGKSPGDEGGTEEARIRERALGSLKRGRSQLFLANRIFAGANPANFLA
jgi:hypothetical protein